jgi:mono/diheme cytochrome c family protein
MKVRIVISLARVVGLLTLMACGGGRAALPHLTPAVIGDTTGLIERGEYIVRSAANCGHCHAAADDPDGPLSGGRAFRNWRLGTVRASNLTPDPATGLGGWSDAEIVRAVRNGVDRHGRVLAPVMPYAWFSGLSERDGLAIARYLRTLQPVRNAVRQEHNLIYAIGEVFFLGPEPSRQPIAPRRAATVEYGGYLAHHVALCADCHTARSGLRNRHDMDRLFAGNAGPPAGFPANPSNITPENSTGIGSWSEDDFVRVMRTGDTPDGRELHPFMPWRQFRRMSEGDLRAIYRYLRTVPPIVNEVPERERLR